MKCTFKPNIDSLEDRLAMSTMAPAISTHDVLRPVMSQTRPSDYSGIAFGAVSWGYATPAALAKTSPALTFASIDDICRLA